MNILLINPPYQTLTSNLGVGHQVPLGLLMVGGPLIDAGHRVRLLDAEAARLSDDEILRAIDLHETHVVLTGHAGSTPAHTTCIRMLKAIKNHRPHMITVYGGVYPSYHPRLILEDEPTVDIIVRGEGEQTTSALIEALAEGRSNPGDHDRLAGVSGIAYRRCGEVVLTSARAPIRDLDACRIGWELIDDWDQYGCFGLGRAAVVQFSRGCPHRCTYCGQHDFWNKWRRRDVKSFVDEVEWLVRNHNVRFCTLADENPTTCPRTWQRLLDELAARQLPVKFFATIRAGDIVRDEALLDLYRKAGILYVLMGIESTDEAVLREVRKGSSSRDDYLACQLLRKHGIFSIIGHIVGLGNESRSSLRRAGRVLANYDGDYLNAMFVTPHSWTAFADAQGERGVVQRDQRLWDYRHQILAEQNLSPTQLFLAVKWLEVCFHLRPRRLWRIATDRDRQRRHQMRWCQWHTFKVWLGEIAEFFLATQHDIERPQSLRDILHRAVESRRAPASLVELTRSVECSPASARLASHATHPAPKESQHVR